MDEKLRSKSERSPRTAKLAKEIDSQGTHYLVEGNQLPGILNQE